MITKFCHGCLMQNVEVERPNDLRLCPSCEAQGDMSKDLEATKIRLRWLKEENK